MQKSTLSCTTKARDTGVFVLHEDVTRITRTVHLTFTWALTSLHHSLGDCKNV